MKINQLVKFGVLITPKYSKSAQVSHQNWNPTICSIWLFAGRAFMSIFALPNFTIKNPRGNQNIDLFDHLYEAILCDSRYVFPALARGVSVLNFGLAEATSTWPKMTFFRIAETQQI